ncbi:hypothetical protein [Polyangium fumosum]|uniref:Uncharacterized protein n=1 Tax=Polyangium fumosum TaxID=889272 RepID=A0A4U1IQI0_9BACT|nr:hypothetical protein [Polyangium fumosum]TKC96402.1 hypothetical protein E8A74_45675 [Polyangium fumosum]
MLLARIRLVGLGPFGDITLPLCDPDGSPRRLCVIFGGEGVGKTAVLSAIATTRPGHAVAQIVHTRSAGSPSSALRADLPHDPRPDVPPFVVAEWLLGDDDPARPHTLCVASPNARLDERDDEALLRRREQALFDRRAAERGFVLVSLSGARWFSRTPVLLTTPERTLLRYDVRASTSFDDASRTDIARETKQVLSFACITAALSRKTESAPVTAARLETALVGVLGALLEEDGCTFVGVDPVRLEPLFRDADDRLLEFDDLPRSLRHLVAFGTHAVRSLAAAFPDRDPRESEGVVLIDDVEIEQPAHRLRTLIPRLRRALPRVQWILTSSSPDVALGCAPGEIIALRRLPGAAAIELHEGEDAVLH